jgi:hypothetical protein
MSRSLFRLGAACARRPFRVLAPWLPGWLGGRLLPHTGLEAAPEPAEVDGAVAGSVALPARAGATEGEAA